MSVVMTNPAHPRTAPSRTLKLGTRASALAMAQSGMVADALSKASGAKVELVPTLTEGDISKAALSTMGGVGVFATALRESLQDKRVDFVVHSMKDLPSAPCPGLTFAAVPERENPCDVLVSADGRTLAQLGPDTVVATGSPRRIAHLRAAGYQGTIVGIRGNVDTRLGKVFSGEVDALILAAAGLRRLGRERVITEELPTHLLVPAGGQGALAVECRDDDQVMFDLCAVLDHAPTRAAVTAERAFLAELGVGCSAPVGAFAHVKDQELVLMGSVMPEQGNGGWQHIQRGPLADPTGLGRLVAQHLLITPAVKAAARAITHPEMARTTVPPPSIDSSDLPTDGVNHLESDS